MRRMAWLLVPFVAINMLWQWRSLPLIPPTPSRGRSTNTLRLLKRRHVAFAMLAAMLSFSGAFSTFTYLRTFLENRTGVDVTQLSLILLGSGVAGFVGTYAASALLPKRLYRLLSWLPLLLAGATVAFLLLGHDVWSAALTLIAWGGLNAAIPVAWSTWLSQGITDEPEAGGGLLVAAIQLSIMLGAGLGGYLLDHFSLTATWLGGTGLLVVAALVAGSGRRLQAGKG
jgi:predicted MFS family arabinose efflux permease